MMAVTRQWLLGLAAALGLAACGPSPEQVARAKAEKEFEEATKKLEAAGKQIESAPLKGGAEAVAAAGEAMKALGAMAGVAVGAAGGGSFEPVDFRRLREALPAELTGFEKAESSGQKNSMLGISVSEATQNFRSADGRRRAEIKVLDPGTLSGPFALANVWISAEVDKESPEGYEKTTTLQGRRVHESWRNAGQHAEIKTVVGGRFLVEVETSGLSMSEAKALLSKIDFSKLEAMKGEGKRS
jgi:hypothetical protein